MEKTAGLISIDPRIATSRSNLLQISGPLLNKSETFRPLLNLNGIEAKMRVCSDLIMNTFDSHKCGAAGAPRIKEHLELFY
jgi:hypothetical protein